MMGNIKKIMTVFLSVAFLSACGGGGGGGVSTGGYYMTHSELADDFVYRMNVDAGFDIQLMKTNTLQDDYIVVYDWDLGTYDAYDLRYYNPGEDVYDYLLTYDYNFYYDLYPVPGTSLYEDPYTGVLFEESTPSMKDLEKMAALEQEVKIQKSADHIVMEYGLSEKRAREVATLAVQLSQADKKSLTDKDYDAFAQEVLGASITEYKSAVKKSMEQGDQGDLNSLIEKAAAKNGLGPEQAESIVKKEFLKM